MDQIVIEGGRQLNGEVRVSGMKNAALPQMVACLLAPEQQCMRLSFRSQSPALPVDSLAHELGGGGHKLAAGARVAGMSVAEAEEKLLQWGRKVFDNERSERHC